MKLKKLKINENEFDFEKYKNIQIVAENNSGKTSFMHLIAFIFGGHNKIMKSDTFFQKAFNKNVEIIIEWIIIINKNELKIEYINSLPDNIIINGSFHKIEDYRELLDNKRLVITQNMYIYNNLHLEADVKKIRTGQFINVNKSASYTSLFLISLLENYNSYDTLNDFFIEQSKLSKVNSINSTIREFQKAETFKSNYKFDGVEEGEIPKVEINDEIFDSIKELGNLEKLKNEEYDYKIVEEMKEIGLSIDIDKILEFHQAVYKNYNEIVEKRSLELKKIISNHLKMTTNTMEEIERIISNLAIYTNELKGSIESLELEDYLSRDELTEFRCLQSEFSQFMLEKSKTGDFRNEIILNKSAKAYNLKIDLNPLIQEGGGVIQINLLYALLFFIKKSSLKFFSIDTTSINEITSKNLLPVIENYEHELGEEFSILLFNHPERKIKSQIIGATYTFGDENPIFGYKF